jgi:8-oxo-dGTP pyrophosphatase MutT (NUDIX family)
MAALVLPPPRLDAWKLARRDRVGSYRVFDVERLAMLDAHGKARGDFFVFACPDWCNVIALTDRDEVVLVWQYRLGTGAFTLEIPGGVCDAGEVPIGAARRELREETGYEASTLEPLVVVEPNPAIQGNLCHTFVARGARRVGAPRFDTDEELEVALVPRSRLADLLDGGQITHALVVLALEAFLRRSR